MPVAERRSPGGAGVSDTLGDAALTPAVAIAVSAARALGIAWRIIDSDYDRLFELSAGGVSLVMLGAVSPVNSFLAGQIAWDKHCTILLLGARGIRCPRTARCIRPAREASASARCAAAEPGVRLADTIGYPVVVKPNRGACGRGVTLADTSDAIRDAVEEIWQSDTAVLVQERIEPPELRLNILDGRFIGGYERVPLELCGDGEATIRQLCARANSRFADDALWRGIDRDPTWQAAIGDRGWGPDTVLSAGRAVSFGDTMLHLHGWATARVIPALPERWLAYCERVAAALSLRHLGLDLRGASLADDPDAAAVLEVNCSPSTVSIHRLGHTDIAVRAQAEVICAAFADRGVILDDRLDQLPRIDS